MQIPCQDLVLALALALARGRGRALVPTRTRSSSSRTFVPDGSPWSLTLTRHWFTRSFGASRTTACSCGRLKTARTRLRKSSAAGKSRRRSSALSSSVSPCLQPRRVLVSHNRPDCPRPGSKLTRDTSTHTVGTPPTVHRIWVNKRPGVDKFLRQLKEFRGRERERMGGRKRSRDGGPADRGADSPTFRVIAFTAGVEMYAKALLEVLDPEGEIFDAQFYRDSCTLYGSAYVKVGFVSFLFVSFRFVSFRFLSFPLISSHFFSLLLIPSHPIPSHPIPSHSIIPLHPIPSHSIPFHPIPSQPTAQDLRVIVDELRRRDEAAVALERARASGVMARLRHSLADPLLAMRSSITDPLGRVLSGGTLSGGGGGGGGGGGAGERNPDVPSGGRIRLGARKRANSRQAVAERDGGGEGGRGGGGGGGNGGWGAAAAEEAGEGGEGSDADAVDDPSYGTGLSPTEYVNPNTGLLDLSRTVLVDNNPISFHAQPENGILVRSFYDDPRDKVLGGVS